MGFSFLFPELLNVVIYSLTNQFPHVLFTVALFIVYLTRLLNKRVDITGQFVLKPIQCCSPFVPCVLYQWIFAHTSLIVSSWPVRANGVLLPLGICFANPIFLNQSSVMGMGNKCFLPSCSITRSVTHIVTTVSLFVSCLR